MGQTKERGSEMKEIKKMSESAIKDLKKNLNKELSQRKSNQVPKQILKNLKEENNKIFFEGVEYKKEITIPITFYIYQGGRSKKPQYSFEDVYVDNMIGREHLKEELSDWKDKAKQFNQKVKTIAAQYGLKEKELRDLL